MAAKSQHTVLQLSDTAGSLLALLLPFWLKQSRKSTEYERESLGYHKLILYMFFLIVLSCPHRLKCGTVVVSNEFNPQASLIAQSFEWKVQPKFSRYRSMGNSSFAVCAHCPQHGG